MSDAPPSRAAELAASQVESIVAAAHDAAEQLKQEQRIALQDAHRVAERDGDEIRAEARRDADRELEDARRKAVRLGEDARSEADHLLGEARREAAEVREQARAAVAGRVAAAEKAAAEVLEEARAISNGLRQLGASLGDHAERILRDVSAAHRRMQADLQVGPESLEPRVDVDSIAAAPSARRDRLPARAPEQAPRPRRVGAAGNDHEPTRASGGRGNPFDELEVPAWVARER